MDPVSVLVAALLAGSAAGISGTASEAVHDAYAGLRDTIRRRLANRGIDGVDGVDAALADPPAHRGELEGLLGAARVTPDDEMVALAWAVLRLADPGGKYLVDVRGAQGVQIGDHNQQTNHFS
jgi:hypothetical protein